MEYLKMYSNKTLVAVGCSHVHGSLGNDNNPITCHERSWVKKLEKLGNFKSSINLGKEGGSNNRSIRVLLEYLEQNKENLVVIFSITELSRKEFPESFEGYINVASWMPVVEDFFKDKRKKEFVETFYTYYQNNNYDKVIINQQVLMLHTLLTSLNIEHYFFEMICLPKTITTHQLGFDIPLINFKNQQGFRINAKNYLEQFVDPAPCCHWDHEGNELFAEYLLTQIKEMRNE